MDFFEKIEQAPPDAIFGLNLSFNTDNRKSKVNLGAGVYKTADLKPLILPSVKEAEKRLLEQEKSKDYLPIDGLKEYVQATEQLVFGTSSERIYGAQTIGGTGALRLGSALLRSYGYDQMYISDPAWANHRRIFEHAGLSVHTYPYFDYSRSVFNFEGFFEALNRMPPRSLVLLQGCCHNPTGFDPSFEQWQQVCERMKERTLFPFFDFAYQGFGEDPEKDAAAIRYFVKAGLQCVVAVSHSKNFGLYAERTGALYFACESSEQAERVGSQLKILVRGIYSNPPCHGARIVSLILHDEKLKKHWLEDLANMRGRIVSMRRALVSRLNAHSDRFNSLSSQQGMFSYTGLDRADVDRLIADYGIYLPNDGRINVAGLTQDNVSYVADAILEIIK